MFAQFLILILALCHHTLSAYPSEARSDKPLFVPTFNNYPTLIHFNPPLSYGSLESSSLYPHYVYDHGQNDYSLQRQFPYQDTEKRLESFLFAGKLKKTATPSFEHANEDDYKQKANKLSLDEIKPDSDDLDLKFKRSLTPSWTSPTLSSTNNLDDRVQPSASRSVPFGPYTTWLPLEGPVLGYGSGTPAVKSTKASLKKTNRRRRREIVYADKEDNLSARIPSQPLFAAHPDYIPVPIRWAPPVIYYGPNAVSVDSVNDVSPINSFYAGKLSAALDTVVQNPDLEAVSYNVVRRK